MYFSLYFVNMLQVRFLLLSCAISTSHGVKLNVRGKLSVGRNAADFLSKVLEHYKGQSAEHTQIKAHGTLHIAAKNATNDGVREAKNVQRNPKIPSWYDWYPWLYDEYKKHKHGHGHKHHKKHHHHSVEYYYSSYEDYNKKHLVIIPGNDGGNKKHMIVNPGGDGGNKKHIVIPSGRNEKELGPMQLLGLAANNWHNSKSEDEQDKPRIETGGSKHSQASEGNKHRKPQYGSEENRQWEHQLNGDKEASSSRPGILRQIWDMYKAIRDRE